MKNFLVVTQETKRGFTLAEVLITLGIIGVVSAITMPMLITNVRNHVRAKRIENIEQKFSKATDKMVALGVYTGLGSTENFVNELGKHLKLAKVCDNDNLQSCWPYEKVLTRVNTNTLWEISKTKDASELKMKDDDYSEWDKTMGIITADGTSMILSYNTKCDIDETKSINYSGSISSTTGCVAVVYDWNGATKPNKYGDDVLSINAKGLHNSCGGVEFGDDLCLGKPEIPTPMTYDDCEKEKDILKIPICCSECVRVRKDNDYWAGAVKKCGGTQNMPTSSDLDKIAEYIYAGNVQERATSLGFPILELESAKVFRVYSREANNYLAYGRGFGLDNTRRTTGYQRYQGVVHAICIGD